MMSTMRSAELILLILQVLNFFRSEISNSEIDQEKTKQATLEEANNLRLNFSVGSSLGDLSKRKAQRQFRK